MEGLQFLELRAVANLPFFGLCVFKTGLRAGRQQGCLHDYNLDLGAITSYSAFAFGLQTVHRRDIDHR